MRSSKFRCLRITPKLGNRLTGNGTRTGSGRGSEDGGELNKENGEGDEGRQASGNAPRLRPPR